MYSSAFYETPPKPFLPPMVYQDTLFHRLCHGTPALCTFLAQIPRGVQVVLGAFLVWLVVVRALRWARYNAIHREFKAKYEGRTMTPEEAQKIMHVSMLYDMPLLLNYALSFALFKTYAIVSLFCVTFCFVSF